MQFLNCRGCSSYWRGAVLELEGYFLELERVQFLFLNWRVGAFWTDAFLECYCERVNLSYLSRFY